ncbi:MAG: hypothetical protein AAB350_02010 [Patescibacteria group bacterium]
MNKWLSSLILFVIFATVSILLTILTDGRYSDLRDPAEFIMMMILPMGVSVLYLLFNFIREGIKKSEEKAEVNMIATGATNRKSILSIIFQFIILFVISVVVMLYLNAIPTHGTIIGDILNGEKSWLVMGILSIPSFIFLLYKSSVLIRLAYHEGRNITYKESVFFIFLAVLTLFLMMKAYFYISIKNYEDDYQIRSQQIGAETTTRMKYIMPDYEPTVSDEIVKFMYTSLGTIDECKVIISDPIHQDESFKSAKSYYCSRIIRGENNYVTKYYYRFVYEKGGIYTSSIFGKFSVDSWRFVDEEKDFEGDQSWLNIGVYYSSGTENLYNISNVGTKVFYQTTQSDDFKNFVKEIKEFTKDWSDVSIKTDNFGGFDRIILKRPDNLIGDTVTDMYVFIGTRRYLQFQNAWDSIINSLEKAK